MTHWVIISIKKDALKALVFFFCNVRFMVDRKSFYIWIKSGTILKFGMQLHSDIQFQKIYRNYSLLLKILLKLAIFFSAKLKKQSAGLEPNWFQIGKKTWFIQEVSKFCVEKVIYINRLESVTICFILKVKISKTLLSQQNIPKSCIFKGWHLAIYSLDNNP